MKDPTKLKLWSKLDRDDQAELMRCLFSISPEVMSQDWFGDWCLANRDLIAEMNRRTA